MTVLHTIRQDVFDHSTIMCQFWMSLLLSYLLYFVVYHEIH